MKLNKNVNIKEVLNNNKWSRETLAHKLNTQVTTIYSWETGTQTPPQKIINKINIITGKI